MSDESISQLPPGNPNDAYLLPQANPGVQTQKVTYSQIASYVDGKLIQVSEKEVAIGNSLEGVIGYPDLTYDNVSKTLEITNINASGDITAANISGINSGDLTISNVSTSLSNPAGMFLTNGNSSTPQNLQLCAADSSNPGVLTAGTQTIGGNKSFTGNINANNLAGSNYGDFVATDVNSGFPSNTGMVISIGSPTAPQSVSLCAATNSHPGVVTTGSQSFAGNKTFVNNITAFNLKNINYGDLTTSAVSSSTPNPTGMQLSLGSPSTPQNLQLCAADASNPGVLTADAQTIGGNKTFEGITTSKLTSVGFAGGRILETNPTTQIIRESVVTSTEAETLTGITGNIQQQLDGKQPAGTYPSLPITNGELAEMSNNTMKANISGTTATPEDISIDVTNTQIVYGTGLGYATNPDFRWDNTAKRLILENSSGAPSPGLMLPTPGLTATPFNIYSENNDFIITVNGPWASPKPLSVTYTKIGNLVILRWGDIAGDAVSTPSKVQSSNAIPNTFRPPESLAWSIKVINGPSNTTLATGDFYIDQTFKLLWTTENNNNFSSSFAGFSAGSVCWLV